MDGPRLPAASGTARQLVVLLHGYGADGNDLIALGREWRGALPDAEFVSPHAPEFAPGGFGGRQWFALTMRDEAELRDGVARAAPAVDAFLDAELARLGLADNNLALVGFSQGAMLALHVGLRRKHPPAAVVGFSGVLVAPDLLAELPGPFPPVLLVHGDLDEVIPHRALPLAKQALAARGIAVRSHTARGLGHGIDRPGLDLAAGFMREAFGM
jgi:phospholipase/carboxylesterase